ncbi:unnamed protein product, partial [Tetraodon nigroviridis]
MAHLKAVYRGLRIIGLVLFYYVFSIGITFYNKWLMKDFHYPLFMTLVHITIIFSLSAITRRILHSWTGKPRVLLSWTDYLHRAAPTGTSAASSLCWRRVENTGQRGVSGKRPCLCRCSSGHSSGHRAVQLELALHHHQPVHHDQDVSGALHPLLLPGFQTGGA